MDRKGSEDELLAPDYNGHPEDDEPLEEIEESDEDARIEKILNGQEELKEKTMDAPFTPPSFPTFGSGMSGGSIGGGQQTPWEKAAAEQNRASQSTSGWGSSWGKPSLGTSSTPWSTPGKSAAPEVDYTIN